MTSDIRHWRMIRNREFDVAELSMSNYLMAKYTGLPFVAIPVFLHRRFRHGFIFLNAAKGIRNPKDLIGRKVGLRNFQATANLWIRGILEHEHGVPHRQIQWLKQDEEEVDWTPPPDLKLQRVGSGKNVESMLVDGELDALIHPELIQPVLDKDRRITRLFPNYRELEREYYRKTGIFPVMHTVVIREELYRRHPWIAESLVEAFRAAARQAPRYLNDEGKAHEDWLREVVGEDPRAFHLGPVERRTLAELVRYQFQQGLRTEPIDPMAVFAIDGN